MQHVAVNILSISCSSNWISLSPSLDSSGFPLFSVRYVESSLHKNACFKMSHFLKWLFLRSIALNVTLLLICSPFPSRHITQHHVCFSFFSFFLSLSRFIPCPCQGLLASQASALVWLKWALACRTDVCEHSREPWVWSACWSAARKKRVVVCVEVCIGVLPWSFSRETPWIANHSCSTCSVQQCEIKMKDIPGTLQRFFKDLQRSTFLSAYLSMFQVTVSIWC